MAATKMELRLRYGNHFGVNCSNCQQVHNYKVEEIIAETDTNAALGGGIAGGLVGLLGGPLGLIIGAVLGGAIGNDSDNSDQAKVKKFNQSR